MGVSPPFPPLDFAALVGGPHVAASITHPAPSGIPPALVGASAAVDRFYAASLGLGFFLFLQGIWLVERGCSLSSLLHYFCPFSRNFGVFCTCPSF